MYVRKISAKGVKVPMRSMSSAQQNTMIEQVTQQLQNISGVFWIGCTQTVQMAR